MQIVDKVIYFLLFVCFFFIISYDKMKQEQIEEVILQKLFFNEYRSNSYFNYSIIRSHEVNEIQGRVTQWVKTLQ